MSATTTPVSPTAPKFGTREERIHALRRCRLFRDWPDARLADLAAIARVARYKRGAQIFGNDPQRREIFMIASGCIEVSRSTAVSKKFVLSVVGPHEALALVRLLPEVPLYYEYHAYEDSVLLHLPCDKLVGILDAEPILWRDVAMLMCSRQGESVRLLNDQTLGALEQRLAAILVYLTRMHGVPGEDGLALGVRLPKEQLGAMLGITRQSTHKVLRALEETGAISADYNRITIRDLAALREIAGQRR